MSDEDRPVVRRQRLTRAALQLWVDLDDRVAQAPDVPSFEAFEGWLETALGVLLARAAIGKPDTLFEISVRVVAGTEMQALNREYRQHDRPTNVLSFPSGLPRLPGTPDLLSLGDIVFCPMVIAAEAEAQGKSAIDHWAHLSVHGVLHLIGHDHQDEAAADAMESLEIQILSELSIANPYLQPSAEQSSR